MRWSALGDTAPTEPRPPVRIPVVGAVAAGLLAVWFPTRLPPWYRPGDELDVVLPLLVAPLIAVLAVRDRWWWARLVLVAAVAVQLSQTHGAVASAALAVALVVTAWIVADRRPVPGVPRCAPGTGLVAVGLALAGGGAMHVTRGRLVGLAALAAIVLVAALGAGRRPRPGVQAQELAWSVDGAATAVVVVLGGLLAWPFRWASAQLAPPVTDRGWVAGPSGDVLASARRSRSRPARRVRWGAVAAVILVLAAAAGLRYVRSSQEADRAAQLMGVGSGGAASSAYEEDIAWVTDERVAFRPFELERLRDVTTRTVNVEDGVRRSWTAPACDCRRVTVWLYGGSAAFGLGQRDDHTVASELARAAAADGYALDVQNRATLGELHWRDATRFSWDLTKHDAPDLVLFYDGAEEVAAERSLQERGLGDIRAPWDPAVAELYEEAVDWPDVPVTPEKAEIVIHGWPRVDEDRDPPGKLAADRYERSRQMSRATARQAGVAAHWYWHPNRYRGTTVAGGADAARYRGASRYLADDVVDLSDLLADVDPPVFSDATTIDERGARLVAAAMWADLRPEVAALAGATS